MQTHLLVGPIPIKSYRQFSDRLLPPSFNPPCRNILHHRRRYRCQRNRRKTTVVYSAYFSSSPASNSGGKNHYVVLGVARNATQVDIKRAYRLLARKFHPDVSKDSRAGELFKTIRSSYEVLSNEVTRTQYDRALKIEENERFSKARTRYNTPEVEEAVKYYHTWYEKRRQRYSTYPNYNETDSEEPQQQGRETKREPKYSFLEALKSAFISLFLLYTLGFLSSLTFSTFSAILDEELDMGYKLGFIVAWILGGNGGILLTLCLTFASWLFGKASSGVVVLVVVAMWIGSNLARQAPLPQGALLTLLYMSIKLQVDSSS